jgi:hypothetical protein
MDFTVKWRQTDLHLQGSSQTEVGLTRCYAYGRLPHPIWENRGRDSCQSGHIAPYCAIFRTQAPQLGIVLKRCQT